MRCDGRPLTCYRAHPTQKYPYLYPWAGPETGRSLTEESGDPYPHHRSILFACDRVNDGNFWQQGTGRGQIVSRGPTLDAPQPDRIVIADACDWQVPGAEPLLTDQRRFTITAPEPHLRILDADITLTARVDVRVRKTNHSLFAVRAAADLTPNGGGALLNSDGHRNESGTFGRTATWCTFYAARGDVIEGVALMDHPDNPWSPCQWFTRDYGFMSPTPMNWLDAQGWSLPGGESVRLRYRVVGYSGDPLAINLPGLYDSWAGA